MKDINSLLHPGKHVCKDCLKKTGVFWHLVTDLGTAYCICKDHAVAQFTKERDDHPVD